MNKKTIFIVAFSVVLLAFYLFSKTIGTTTHRPQQRVEIEIHSLSSAIKMYKLDNGQYPDTEQGLNALVERPSNGNIPSNWRSGGYLDSSDQLIDPWGIKYYYACPGRNGDFEIYSFGSDQKPGGKGYAKDVYSWEME